MSKVQGSFMVQLDGKDTLYWATPLDKVDADTPGIDAKVLEAAKAFAAKSATQWLFVTIGAIQAFVPELGRVTAIKVGTAIPPTGGAPKT